MMVVVRLLFFFFLFTLFGAVCAQSRIEGTIVSASHSPVAFAGVILKRTDNTNERNAQTDSTGTFIFNQVINGAYSITITSVGYESYKLSVEISRDTSFTIQLQQS